MIIRSLHLLPLCCRKIILGGLFFLGTSPSLYCVSHLRVRRSICTYPVRMCNAVSGSTGSPFFFNSFWMTSLIRFLICLDSFRMVSSVSRRSFSSLFWMYQCRCLFRSTDFVCIGHTICRAIDAYLFTVCRLVSGTMRLSLFRIFVWHYCTLSRFAFSRMASSMTPVMLNPNFSAMCWRSRFASGLRRKLSAGVFSMHHYDTFSVSMQARMCP